MRTCKHKYAPCQGLLNRKIRFNVNLLNYATKHINNYFVYNSAIEVI